MLSVRIDPSDHKTLKDLSKTTDRPMADLIGDAIQDLKRKFILEATNNAYRSFQQNKRAWTAHLKERGAWDAAELADIDLEHWK